MGGVLKKPKAEGEFNMGLGLLGAFLGAALGSGIVYGFAILTNYRMPFTGTIIGALSGLGARTLFKGTESTLGGLTAGIALASTTGVLYLIHGEFSPSFLITMAVSAYFAYRIAG